MISFIIPGALAFVIIFGAVSYEIYNQLSRIERDLYECIEELRKSILENTKSMMEKIIDLKKQNSAFGDEVFRLKDEIKRIKKDKEIKQ